MAIQVEWVKQSVSGTPGTGAITLGTAQVGFIRFQDDTRVTDGSLVHYTIQDGNDRERGVGTYNAGVLTRTVVQAKLQSSVYSEYPISPLSLTSSAVVSCSSISQRIRGASVRRSTDQSIPSGSSVNISWQVTEFDTDSFFNLATNPDRFTVTRPDINRIKLSCSCRFSSAFIGEVNLVFLKNGSIFHGSAYQTSNFSSQYGTSNIFTGPISVQLGDYFSVVIYQATGATQFVGATGISTSDMLTWFSLEVVV